MSDPILDEHFAQMKTRHAAAYSIVETSGSGPLADLIISEELSAPDLSQISEDGVTPLLEALKTASPDRKCMQYVLTSFGGWLRSVPPAGRTEFLINIPKLAPATRDLGDEGMKTVLEAAALEPRVLAPIAAYAMTTAAAIRAMATLATAAAKQNRPDLLEELAASFPAEKMEESKDAENLLPALAKMDSLELAVVLAKTNPAGARAAANSFAKALSNLPPAYKADCVSAFTAIGPRATGFCVNTLPGIYQKHGEEAARRFVALACEAAKRHGQIAGQAFLERQTQASASALS
jgi:hypothetical protein